MPPIGRRAFDLDRLVGDVAAVVDDLRLPRFSLGAAAQSGPVALAYAARNPERVQRLLGWCTYAQGSVIEDSGFIRALRRFPPTDWDLAAATLAQVAVGWPDRHAPDIETVVADMASAGPPLAARVAAVFAGATSARMWPRFHLDAILHDARPELSSLRARTLLLCPRRSRMLSRDRPRQLAAAMPGAELRLVRGSAVLPFVEQGAETAETIVVWVLRADGTRQAAGLAATPRARDTMASGASIRAGTRALEPAMHVRSRWIRSGGGPGAALALGAALVVAACGGGGASGPDAAADDLQSREFILVPDDAAEGDEFGWSVDTDGSRIIVGAPFHDDLGPDSGAAYIFRRRDDGGWVREAKLLADDGEAKQWFGRWGGIDGDVAVVGAPFADLFNDDDDAGAAYVFERRDDAWVLTQRLTAPDAKAADQLGWVVAIIGDTIAAAASNLDDGGGQTVYVFRRDGDLWVEEAALRPLDPSEDGFFGVDFGLAGDVIAVASQGVHGADEDTGAVYVFERGARGWAQTAKLEPPDTLAFDLFGNAVSVGGDTIVAGAFLNDEAADNGGAVYVYARTPAGWQLDQKLLGGDPGTEYWLGFDVATDGASIVAGAPRDASRGEPVTHSGTARVFQRSATGWMETAGLRAGDAAAAGAGADYGWATAQSGDVIVVGAWLADTEDGRDAGRAYVYRLEAP